MTALIGNATIDWLNATLAARADARAHGAAPRPFFALIAPHAPHVPATPAPWYESAPLPNGGAAPRTPSWNVASNRSAPGASKPWFVEAMPDMLSTAPPASPDGTMADASDAHSARRLRSLMSVDDLLSATLALLEGAGALEETFIF
jgi:hypothetical protein